MRFLYLLVITMLGAPGVAFAQQAPPGDVFAGERLARELCAACHVVADDQYELMFNEQFPEQDELSLYAPPFGDAAEDPAVAVLGLRVFLRTPHLRMPNLLLTDDETDDVIAYILGLR